MYAIFGRLKNWWRGAIRDDRGSEFLLSSVCLLRPYYLVINPMPIMLKSVKKNSAYRLFYLVNSYEMTIYQVGDYDANDEIFNRLLLEFSVSTCDH